jgi:hypothetical protein
MTSASDSAPGYSWGLLAYALGLAGLGFIWVAWLLGSYVPFHVAIYSGLGLSATLPASTIWVLALSNWFLRFLPFGVLLCPPIGAAAVAAPLSLALARGAGALALRWVVSGLLLLGLAEGVSGALVVHAIHEAYVVVASDPRYQESTKAFEEFQRQRRSLEPTRQP